MSVTMEGQATSFAAVALQEIEYKKPENQQYMSNVIFSNIDFIGKYKHIPNNKPNIKLLSVSICNSDILMSINISINKNSIDTAPI